VSATSIKSALNYLNERIDLLDDISKDCEVLIQGDQRDLFGAPVSSHANENKIEREKLVLELDKTIDAVEKILKEG